jgi:hypothetical protein
MNAPLVANIENIVMFREILGEAFVEETLARQREIQNNKRDTLLSLDKIKENCNQISVHMRGIESGFKQLSTNFNKLENTSIEFAEKMLQFSKSSKKLAETFRKDSQDHQEKLEP